MEDFDFDSAVDTISDGLGFEPLEKKDDVAETVGTDISGTDSGAGDRSPSEEAGKAADAAVPADGDVGKISAGTADIAPKTWTPAAAEKWATLDPLVKAEIQKREDDMFRGIEGYKEDATYGKGLKAVLAPYLPILQQHNIDPMKQVGQLMNAHYTFATGSPQEKGQLLGRLLADYKIDPELVPLPGGAGPHVDPAVQDLQQRLQGIESAQQARLREEQDAIVNRFFSDPANVYAKELGPDMAQLISKGIAKDLKDAYERAIWQNPITREKEVSRKAEETAKAAKAAEEAKAAEARKASAANVRARAKSGSAAAPLGTMDDTMSAVLAEIRSRSN